VPLCQITLHKSIGRKHRRAGIDNSKFSTAQKSGTATKSDSSNYLSGQQNISFEENKELYEDFSDGSSPERDPNQENIAPTDIFEEIAKKCDSSPVYDPEVSSQNEDSFENEISQRMALNKRAPLGDITPFGNRGLKRTAQVKPKEPSEPLEI